MPGHAGTGGRDVIFAWEQCKLGDVFSFLKNSTLSRSELNYESGKFKYIHYGDILTKFGDITDTRNFSVPFVTTPEKVIRLEKYFLQNGDVVIADTAEDSMVGKVTEIQNPDPFPTVSGLHTIPIRPNKEFAAGFLGHYMNAPFYHDQLFKLMQGVKVLSLSKSAVIQTKINSPSYCEQRLISRMINLIDGTITLHEEKKRQLERLKSALLQKMFADKSGYPPVRFEGFSDKWEQVKYGEIFQRRSKMGVSTPTLPSVEYDDINPGMGTLNKEPKSKGISKRGIYFNPGDVLFGKLRPYLKNWLFACFEGVAVGDFWVLTSSKIDHGFTYSLIQTPGFQYIANLSSGSKMPRSDWGLVSNARTFIPINHLEQERISSVLFGLDHAITLYEHKLEILNKIKSFLLQNMFI
ncbi:restriction endonuclease subunit S [Lactobacillus delbrueckii subsp. bulgaricus]|nr:restriction endonuclease subunit S [Lactobacillus delbrueckii]MCT3514063.1 restriction endonuclease subunit S [Lactobacillus delbrueckii subsp. bulgaricus]